MFTQVTVTRDYDLADGTDPSGIVYFTPSAWLVNGVTVPAAEVAVALDIDGVLTVDLFANTDPGTTPTGSYYTVREVILGQPTRTYRVIIPHDLGSPLDLALMASVYPSVLTGLSVGYGLGYGTGYGLGYGTGYGTSTYGTSGYGV
jgi:hypothetical protein